MAPSLAASCVILELRSLPSSGVTRLRRYYEPLRHLGYRPVCPSRDSGCRSRPRTAEASLVALVTRFDACRRPYPGGTARCLYPPARGPWISCRSLPSQQRPSRSLGSVGFRVFRFEACSAFTARFGLHRRQIAKQSFPPETPTGSSPPPPLQLLTGQERPQPGGIPTRKTTNAFPRRT